MNNGINFDLFFTNIDVGKTDQPNIILHYNVVNKGSQNNKMFIKIIQIDYKISLCFFTEKKSKQSEDILPDEYSHRTHFFEDTNSVLKESLEILIPFQLWDKIIKIFFEDKLLGLQINTTIHYEIFQKINNHYVLVYPTGSNNSFIHDSENNTLIMLNSDKISSFIQKNNYKEKIVLKIPAIEGNDVNQTFLTKALKNLKTAKTKYNEGNIEGFLLSIRN